MILSPEQQVRIRKALHGSAELFRKKALKDAAWDKSLQEFRTAFEARSKEIFTIFQSFEEIILNEADRLDGPDFDVKVQTHNTGDYLDVMLSIEFYQGRKVVQTRNFFVGTTLDKEVEIHGVGRTSAKGPLSWATNEVIGLHFTLFFEWVFEPRSIFGVDSQDT